MFKEYQSKQITRLAHKIVKGDVITSMVNQESTYLLVTTDNERALFKAYDNVKVGDYVVRLTVEDTCHCDGEVFADRNIVEDEDHG